MPNTWFVSYVYEDIAWLNQLQSWADAGQLGDIELVTESEDVRQEGEAAVRKHLRPKLTSAGGLILLVGNDTHRRDWIDYEVANRQSAGKPIVVVRIPNTTGGAPPAARGLPMLDFSPKAVAAALK